MISSLGIEIGSAWSSHQEGIVLIIVNKRRTGHQYDRHYSCSCLLETGKIIEIDDYILIREYNRIGDKDDKAIS